MSGVTEGADRADGPDASDADKRHDQLTTAPRSTEEDAAPRIHVSEGAGRDGATRIDIRDDADVRPGGDPDLT
ncbi:MAG: multidrug transporter [Herbiconiux sp.]|nr:multidrug transporter [Herbiconiux sp.]